MPKVLTMPPVDQLPEGPRRRFVEELFAHYREAGRPTLRAISQWITDNTDRLYLRGTASTETIRRVLNGRTVPSWPTTETILEALCGLAGRSTDEQRWPDNEWSGDVTFKDELKLRWNAALDQSEGDVPALPPRSDLPSALSTTPSWSTSSEEPPF